MKLAHAQIADELDRTHQLVDVYTLMGRWLMSTERLGRFDPAWGRDDARYLASAGRARWEEIYQDRQVLLAMRPRRA
jgi:hypothetical protein